MFHSKKASVLIFRSSSVPCVNELHVCLSVCLSVSLPVRPSVPHLKRTSVISRRTVAEKY